MKTIFVIEPTFGMDKVFRNRGYRVINSKQAETETPDVVAWMGGTDVNPALYGEENRYSQRSDNYRDEREIKLWRKFKDLPKVGICRGAQLLNVLNGGRMYQHVDGHAGENHEVTDIFGEKHVVCSVHHQMIIPAQNAKLVAWAEGRSKHRFTAEKEEEGRLEKEPEVLFIPDDKALCFQAHPEFGPQTCEDYFFKLFNHFIEPMIGRE